MPTDNGKTSGRTTIPVSISMTPEEQEIIQRAAEADHRSVSSFVKVHILPIAERLLAEHEERTPAAA